MTPLSFVIRGPPTYEPVSYTHLDVYKRQTHIIGLRVTMKSGCVFTENVTAFLNPLSTMLFVYTGQSYVMLRYVKCCIN